jgi:peptide/nickel transport system ATP-binding protein
LEELVRVKDLTIRFHSYEGVVQALNGVNFSIYKGETLGIVGETGSGKTVTGLALLRLIMPPGKIEGGSILFDGDNGPVDLLKTSEAAMREIRGSQIAMVFQEPGSALNPVFPISDQLTEAILLHRREEVARLAEAKMEKILSSNPQLMNNKILAPFRIAQKKLYRDIGNNTDKALVNLVERTPLLRRMVGGMRQEANDIAISLLREVEIPDAARIMKQYPHELSGGMKQRIVIAMALSCCSKLIIADEPTTALDVTIQLQIVELLKKLKKETASSILYITHNLGVAAEICDRVAVMYAGNICEIASVYDIFKNPLHPYTQALMAAVPKPGVEPKAIGGFVADALSLPSGCRFHPRCQRVGKECTQDLPSTVEVEPGHFVTCHLFQRGNNGTLN